MTVAAGGPERTDQELIAAARQGDRPAFGVLWGRHSEAGRRVARSITHTFDADDLVSEAYLKIMTAVMSGKGPTGPFRPYLFVTIRNLAVTLARQRREGTLDEAEEVADPRATDAAVLAALDSGLTLQAFRTLPERWQEVLWFTEVDALSPAEIADRLEMSANSVAALAYRAREGLRQAWIQAHIDTSAEGSEHQWVLSRVGKSARNALSVRNKSRFDQHLAGCPACTVIADEAVDASRRFTSVLLPLAVGITGTAGLGAFLHASSSAGEGATVVASRRSRGTSSTRRRVWAVPAAVLAVALIGSGIGYAIDSDHRDEADSERRLVEAGSPTGAATATPTAMPSSTASPPTGVTTTPSASPDQRSAAPPPASAAPRTETQTSPVVPAPTAVAEVVPVIVSADTADGVLLPIIRGTARPTAAVTVRLGSTSVTVATDASGSWRTSPVNVGPGKYTLDVWADGLTATPTTVTVAAPVLSLSRAGGSLMATVRGAPETEYVLQTGSARPVRVTTNASGAASGSFAASDEPREVRAYAVDGQRTGPTTAITSN